MEFNILQLVAKLQSPIGSGTIHHELRKAGIDLSEATAGRILRELDRKGYTERLGFQGRRLTNRGVQRLQELQEKRTRDQYGSEFLETLRSRDQGEIIDSLIARRAIERETVKLAASLATEEEILMLRQALERHRKRLQQGLPAGEEEVEFHKLVARAARNRILEAALELMRQQGELSPIFEYIRARQGRDIVSDHEKILQAIEKRNPALAERALERHLENVIQDVEKFWEHRD